MNLYNIIKQSAESNINLQKEDGSMPPGWNGPYRQKETSVRNTSHWLITFLKAYEITKDTKYKEAANKCAEYLLSDKARPMNATFFHRELKNKDKSNGLIGQAWTIEALIAASEKLQISECKNIAKEVFLLHPYDEKCNLWKRVDVDGKKLGFDYVFNHQLWFAACGSMIDNKEVRENITQFIDNIDTNLKINKDGLIHHFIFSKGQIKTRIFNLIIKLYLIKKGKRNVQLLEEGYQSFNLYAFALLKNNYIDHPFWKSNKFIQTLDHIKIETYSNVLNNNKYGFPYNPVGFENAYAIYTFPDQYTDNTQLLSYWVTRQINEYFDFEKKSLSKNTEDSVTLTARIYEATRLPDVQLNI